MGQYSWQVLTVQNFTIRYTKVISRRHQGLLGFSSVTGSTFKIIFSISGKEKAVSKYYEHLLVAKC